MEDIEENCLITPEYLSNEEKVVWDEIVEILQKSTSYARTIEFFYEFLAKYGIKEVCYYSIRDNFLKHYGYFIKN